MLFYQLQPLHPFHWKRSGSAGVRLDCDPLQPQPQSSFSKLHTGLLSHNAASFAGVGAVPQLHAGAGGHSQSSSLSSSYAASVPSHGSIPSQASRQNSVLLTTSAWICGCTAREPVSAMVQFPSAQVAVIVGFRT